MATSGSARNGTHGLAFGSCNTGGLEGICSRSLLLIYNCIVCMPLRKSMALSYDTYLDFLKKIHIVSKR